MGFTEAFKGVLTDRFGKKVQFSEPMARHTTYGVGGPADALVFMETEADIEAVIRLCRDASIPYFVLGGGSNLLVPDSGVEGVGIHVGRFMDRVEIDPATGKVSVMAGCRLGVLRQKALGAGLGGLEFTVGIPGTVGGAVRMNAGTREGQMADVVTALTLVDGNGRTWYLSRSDITFGYRRLSFGRDVAASPAYPEVITQVTLALAMGDRQTWTEKGKRILAERKTSQPVGVKSAGCFFKNPAHGPSAGALIDDVGLKGYRIGGAQISRIHANFIVNTGAASATDIFALARLIRNTVAERHGIWLEPEVVILGGVENGTTETATTESEKG